MRIDLIVASAVLLAVSSPWAGAAQEPVVLEYVGNPFTSVNQRGTSTPPYLYTTSDRVTGWVELSAPLAPNLNQEPVIPLAHELSAADLVMSESTPDVRTAFYFWTDDAGRPTFWIVADSVNDLRPGGKLDTVRTYNCPPSSGCGVEDFSGNTLCGPSSTSIGCPLFGDPWYATSGRNQEATGQWSYRTTDSDADGVADDLDSCPDTAAAAVVDSAGCSDGQVDNDGDGVCDPGAPNVGPSGCTGADNCPLAANVDQADSDGDSNGDACDDDDDNDGILDTQDNCPLTSNPAQFNNDGDTNGDACDDDDDNDGTPDTVDNCHYDGNPEQSDFDGDGAGDACDKDDDNDGVIDAADACMSTEVGEAVNADGCALAELCPCDNLWKNHGGYVSCVAHATKDFVAANLISEAEKSAIVSAAGLSSCGAKEGK